MPYDVFISYRRSNGFHIAKSLHDNLQTKGINCFLDLDELHAGTFDDKIMEAIRQAPNFILILPSGALDRCVNENDWVRKEIQMAVGLHKNIIPVLYDGFAWPNEWNPLIPQEIRQLERINCVLGSTEYFSAMIDKIINYMTDVEVTYIKSKQDAELRPLNIAVSNLTVIDGLMQGWDYENTFRKYGFKVEKHNYKWSDKVLSDLNIGKLDIAVYNKESCKRFNNVHNGRIKIIRDVCSSMGGRNFYILASIHGRWNNMTLEQFKNSLDNKTVIGVPRPSDMYQNLLYILDMTEDELQERGVKLINFHSDQGLDIFEVIPDLLVIAGQDTRFLAEQTEQFTEVISYDDFPQDKKRFFFNNSINSLLVGPSGLEKLDWQSFEKISIELMLNFYSNVMSSSGLLEIKKRLARQLNNICENEDSIDYILNKILFETYRII